MANTLLQIVNDALVQLGERPITALDGSSHPARIANEQWPKVRDEVLRMHPWRSAIAREKLAPMSASPAFGYDNQFQLPSDFVKLVRLYDHDEQAFRRNGDKILSDADSLKMIYIARPEDPASLDPLLQSAMAAQLGVRIAMALNRSVERVSMMRQLFDERLREARFQDAADSPGEELELDSSWLEAFESGQPDFTANPPLDI